MIHYRLATPADNEQLIALTALCGMDGEISLRIDRYPNFFSLLQLRGPTNVFVAETSGEIIGCVCVSLQQVYVGKEILPLRYIGDFKVAPAFRNKGVGIELCNQLANYVVAQGADLAFLNVSMGNTKPLSFFKNRPQVPDFENIGVFTIHQFVGKRKPMIKTGLPIESSAVTPELLVFLNAHYRRYELGTVISSEMLAQTEIWVARINGELVSVMCLFDTMRFKQNVVTRVSARLKLLMAAMNAVRHLSGLSRMPSVNKPIGMLYVRFLAINAPGHSIARQMINHARQLAYERTRSFVSLGLHEKDPLNRHLRGMFRLSFKSVGMLLSIRNNETLVKQVQKGIPFEDYSLV